MRLELALTIMIGLVLFFSGSLKAQGLENYDAGINKLQKADISNEIDYIKAHEFFEKSVQENPNHVESKYWKMYCEIRLGDLDQALMTATSVIDDSEQEDHILIPHFYISAGLIEKNNNQLNAATNYFSHAIEIYNSRIGNNINNTDAILNKAITLCYMNKKDGALIFLDSISLNEEKQILLEQIKKEILEFDSENILSKLEINRGLMKQTSQRGSFLSRLSSM